MDQAVRQAVERGFAKQAFMQTLNARLFDVGEGICEIELPYSEALTQQHGFFHGGVVATIADNAAGFAAYSLMADDRQPLTVEFKINLIAPAAGDRLLARGKVLNAGRSIFHVASNVHAFRKGEETLVASALATIKSTLAVAEIN